jgi:hypothetical protein
MSRAALIVLAVLSVSAIATLTVAAADEKKAEPGKPIVLFNGKDLTGWKVKGNPATIKWVVGRATLDEKNASKLTVVAGGEGSELINPSTSGDLYSEQKFGDGIIDVEFMVPKGSNSGVYIMGTYEIQILDSFGKEKVGAGDLGAVYGISAPKVNASKKPGEWQRFVIEYQAPRFDGDKKTANGKVIKVTLNDQVIQENVELKGPTGGSLTGKEAATGPVMFQGDHGPVAFRNVKFTPKEGK